MTFATGCATGCATIVSQFTGKNGAQPVADRMFEELWAKVNRRTLCTAPSRGDGIRRIASDTPFRLCPRIFVVRSNGLAPAYRQYPPRRTFRIQSTDSSAFSTEEHPFVITQRRLIMPSRISSTSSFHSAYTAPSRSDTRSPGSQSQRSLATNASLDRLSSRASTTAGSYITAAGSDAGSVYGSVASHLSRRTVSDIGSSTRSRLSNRGNEAHHATHSEFGSETSSAAQASVDDVAQTLSQASWSGTDTIRRSPDSSEHHSHGSDWIDMDFNRTVRDSTSSRPSSVSSEHHSRGSDWIDIDLRGTSQRSVAVSDRRSEIAEALSQAGTPSERSFHLSERSSVAAALRNGRLGYSSDSSRRLTSYEGSSRTTSVAASSVNGSVAPSYVGSLTPSDRSALRAARLGGRFAVPNSIRSNRTSLDSDYEAYLREGDDVVAPLPVSRFRPMPSTAPSDPGSIASAIRSRRLDRTPSLSRHFGDSGRSSRFGGADVEPLASAGSQTQPAERVRQLWELLKEDH